MIVYLATKETFRADILSNRIEEKILGSLLDGNIQPLMKFSAN